MARAQVSGWCWPQSVEPGGAVSLHLSATATDGGGDRDVEVVVTRVGAEREVRHTATVAVGDHPVPADASTEGCRWPAAATIEVGDDWTSGFHEVHLRFPDPAPHDPDRVRDAHAFFVVRPRAGAPTPGATALLPLATNTWHAYNDFGGPNLYTGATSSSLQRPLARGLLHKPLGPGRRVTNLVDDDRQMTAHVGYLRLNHLTPWGGSAGWPDWEQPLIEWAESEGHVVDVCTNADLEGDAGAALVAGYRLLLSVGHDEYWSSPMRDTVEAHVAGGGNVAFLSGNTSFWQVRLEDPDDAGAATRMVGFKGRFREDPVQGTERAALTTSMWSDLELERPENRMTGVSFSRGGYHRIGKRATNGAGGYTIHRADHWLFEDTDLDYGDVLGGASRVVGYECDGCALTYVDGRPVPTGEDGTPDSFVILGTAPACHFTRTTAARPPAPHEPSEIEFIASRLFGSRDPGDVARIEAGHAVLGTWTSPGHESGRTGTVVTSGSTDWAHGLGRTPGTPGDHRIQAITRTILERLGGTTG